MINQITSTLVKWRPLSQRTGEPTPEKLYEGMPEHMLPHVLEWFAGVVERHGASKDDPTLRTIAMHLRLPMPSNAVHAPPRGIAEALIDWAKLDQGFCLDLLDIALFFWGPRPHAGAVLDEYLRAGGSAWKVASNKQGLERVVDETMQATYQAAISTQDEAAAELSEAWTKAYGRSPDPSDAWDHAIKAVEHVLIPVVVPNKAKATLSNVVGTLGSPQSSSTWKMILPTNNLDYDAGSLASLLRLLWPNPDRHGSGTASHTPSLDEARAVVCLAATLIQWDRQAWIVQKRSANPSAPANALTDRKGSASGTRPGNRPAQGVG